MSYLVVILSILLVIIATGTVLYVTLKEKKDWKDTVSKAARNKSKDIIE